MTAVDSSSVTRLAGWWRRRRSGRTLVLAWVCSRALMMAVFVLAERSVVVGDVRYYHREIAAMAEAGLASTLTEYPVPVVWLLSLPYGLGAGTDLGYVVAFVAMVAAVDGAFTVTLYVARGRVHDSAADFWLVFVLLVGPLSFMRVDIVPAVLAGGALVAARTRPALAGALTALGAAVKLWPAVVVGALAARRPGGVRVGAGFVLAGSSVAAVSLLTGGWDRLVSPLSWQSDRGLQIESVWATPLLAARAVRPDVWTAEMSPYHAYQAVGPGTGGLLTAATLATLAGFVTIAVLLLRAFRHPQPSLVAIGLVMLATVAVIVVTNKALSPQYLLWLGAPMAALSALAPPPDRRMLRRLAVRLLTLAVLTHLVYPVLYEALLGNAGSSMLAVATVVLVVRNLVLLVFTVQVCTMAWSALRHP